MGVGRGVGTARVARYPSDTLIPSGALVNDPAVRTNRLFQRLLLAGESLPRTFWVLWWGMFINRLGMFVIPFLSLYLTRERGLPLSTAGVVAASYGVGAAIASQLGGYLADHVGRRATSVLALTLGGIAMASLGFVSDVRLIVTLAFVGAMLNECYRPAVQAMVSDVVPVADRARAFSVMYWVINLGVSLGLVLGGALARHSFAWLFVLDGLTSFLFGVLIWTSTRETKPQAPGGQVQPLGLLGEVIAPYRDLAFVGFLALSTVSAALFLQEATALPVDIAAHGIAPDTLGWILAVNGGLIVFVQPLLGPVITRGDRSRVLAAGVALIGLGFGLTSVAHEPWEFAATVAIWTLGEILVLPTAVAVVADIALPHMRGRYQGAYTLTWSLAMVIAPLIGTSVMQRFDADTLWHGCLVAGLAAAAGQLALGPHLARLRAERSAAS